jgi:hypothetical protein
MKEYRKTATVKAKLFEKGDEDGMTWTESELSSNMALPLSMRDKDLEPTVPYISTLENQKHKGEFGKHYLCVGVKGEKWLVEKEIFESTYEAVH